MEDFGSGSTTWAESSMDYYPDVPATSEVVVRARRLGRPPAMMRTFRPRKSQPDPSAFSVDVFKVSPSAVPQSTGALPGEQLTEQVAANVEDRRVLLSVFQRFAAEGVIGSPTLHTLEAFVGALPRARKLPTVSPDGEGGLQLAWLVPGRGRTLVAVADETLFAVADAGTPQAQYLPEIDFTGALPDELLALIPE